MPKLKHYPHNRRSIMSIARFQAIKYKVTLYCFIIFALFITKNANAQTTLDPGDIAIIGVNADNDCNSEPSQDVVSFIAFKDITNGTAIDITDNGWERVFPDFFGDSEGTFRFTYNAGTIAAGTTFELFFDGDVNVTNGNNPSWDVTDLNFSFGGLNMNSSGDQIFVMQDGIWDNGGMTGDHDATYSGRILYGFNTRSVWQADGTSQQSNLHPEVDPCYHMEPTSGSTEYISYSGPTSPATQLEWINRFGDSNNWTTYGNCASYIPPPSSIEINSSGMSIDCSICSGCGTVNTDLTFNLPSSGGPFNVVYTDGTTEYTLNGINNGHIESVTVNVNTTFELVSVTDSNGCPVYSNFDGEATIIVDAGGGDASLSGGGVLCTGNCSEITFTVSGGQAPYDIEFELSIGPFNITFPIVVPNTNFTINICSDDVAIPEYDLGTNTLTLPDFIVTTGSVTLVSLIDDNDCEGTVDPTPLSIDIYETPEANSAGPLNACDEGSGQATFDLTSLDNGINGNSGNPVDWFTDQQTNNQIGDPANFVSGSTTVYATVSTAQCTSDPVAIDVIVEPIPIANPASAEACGDINGQATFDLTTLDEIVNGNNGNPVNWYLDVNGNNPISNPTSYPTTGGIVYATVISGNCESTTSEVTLTVNPSPSAFPASDELCDEGGGIATFDLTALENIVNGGSGDPVNWYSDPNANVPINAPSNYTTTGGSVYAVVSNGLCESSIVEITLTVIPNPVANPTTATECDDGSGIAVFDLTTLNEIVNGNSGNPVNWYIDAGTIPISNPSSFSSPGGIIWANVENGICISPLVEILLIVVPSPVANPTSESACDDGNGTATFDLTSLDFIVNNGTSNTVNWYLDINGVNPVPDPTNYTSGNGFVYAQVADGNCTSAIVEISLSIIAIPTANSTSDIQCEENAGQATFDLTSLDNIVNGGSGNPVTWFLDSSGTIPIPNPDNYLSGSGTVYAIVNDGICNSLAAEITLVVTATPQANTTSADECDDGNGTATFDLTALETTVNGGNSNTVNWFEDDAGNIPISSPYTTGSTTVYATVEDGNCVSEFVEITLNVIDIPQANATSADECDDGNGTATFDLTALESTVNGGNSNTVNWFEDDAGNIPISSPYTTGSTTIYATVGDGNCISEIVAITLNVGDAPQANTTSADECDDGSGTATFDLTALESTVNGGTANTVNWFEDANASIPISSPYTTASTTIYATVGDGNCVSGIVEITLNVVQSPDASPASASACDDGNGTATFDLTALENIVNTGNGNPVNWYQDPAATIPISSPYVSSSTVVYANVGSGNCISITVGVQLTVLDAPLANAASASACEDGNGTATFDLTALENTVNGGTANSVSWFEDDAGTIPISSPYTTGSTIIYATVDNGTCVSAIVEIMLNVVNSPQANTASTEQCDDGNGTATFDLTVLESIVNGGTANLVSWFEDDAGTIPISSPYTTASSTIYAIVGDGNCISESVEIMLNVVDSPQANPTSASECDDGNGTATFDLSLIESTVNGGTANTVNWFEDDAGTIPISSPYTTASTTIYATVGDGNCISEIVGIQLNVGQNPDSAPAFTSECDDGNGTATFNLTALESIVNAGTANPVSWYQDIASTIPISSPYISASTTVYAIVGTGNCVSSIVGVQLTVLDAPLATPASLEACDDGNGTATFDLTAFENTVNGGTANPVNWFEDDNATIPILSPFISTSTTIFATVDDGNCASQIVEINLTVLDNPLANATSAEACDEGSGTATFDLTALENTVNGGTANSVNWFEDDNATIPILSPFISTSNTIFATVDDGNCTSQIVEINLTVLDNPLANATSANECDDGNGMATFDLTALESIVNGGTANPVNWFEDIASTIPISSPYTSASTIIYAVVSNGNCTSGIVEVSLNAISAPEANTASAEGCDEGNGTASFDLATLESIVNGGTSNTVNWFEDPTATIPISSPYTSASTTIYANVGNGNCISDVVAIDLNILAVVSSNFNDMLCEDENIIINGTIYDVNNPSGTETIQAGASNGCDSIVFVTLDFFEPVLGTISGENTICDGQSLDLTFNLSGANSYDVEYSDGINPAILLNGISDGQTITVFPTATTTYSLISVTGNGIPCSPTFPTSSVTVTVTSIVASINILTDYQGFSVSCNNANDGAAEVTALTGTAPFSFQWSDGSTTSIASSLSAGSYTVTVTDATGCTVIENIILSQPSAIEATTLTISPDCISGLNGSILIENVTGGAGIYEYSLDGELFTPIFGFPIEIPFLSSGNYELFIQDINDCAISQNLVIQAPVSYFVNLGNDIEIVLGDSVQLNAEADFEVAEIFWNPEENLSCLDCLDPIARPFETTDYTIVVIDSIGCSATDDITISVKKSRNVFIPSAFSPNGDGTNDDFYVFAGTGVVEIKQFSIFSRWGELIYNINNIQPNDRAASWNGEFKGERLNPGVFVYLIEIEFADGKTFIYKGDITLMK